MQSRTLVGIAGPTSPVEPGHQIAPTSVGIAGNSSKHLILSDFSLDSVDAGLRLP